MIRDMLAAAVAGALIAAILWVLEKLWRLVARRRPEKAKPDEPVGD